MTVNVLLFGFDSLSRKMKYFLFLTFIKCRELLFIFIVYLIYVIYIFQYYNLFIYHLYTHVKSYIHLIEFIYFIVSIRI